MHGNCSLLVTSGEPRMQLQACKLGCKTSRATCMSRGGRSSSQRCAMQILTGCAREGFTDILPWVPYSGSHCLTEMNSRVVKSKDFPCPEAFVCLQTKLTSSHMMTHYMATTTTDCTVPDYCIQSETRVCEQHFHVQSSPATGHRHCSGTATFK